MNVEGYDFIVPLITHERFLESIREGVLVNLGFLPAEFRKPVSRKWMLNSEEYINFTGVVTKNKNLQKKMFFKDGNVNDEQRFSLKNFNLKNMADYSSLSNKENVSEALIERVDVNVTGLDEKHPMEYNVNLNSTQNIPFGKVNLIKYIFL